MSDEVLGDKPLVRLVGASSDCNVDVQSGTNVCSMRQVQWTSANEAPA